jgi:hypothetical protein
MEAFREVIHRRRDNPYHEMTNKIEPIFTIFRTLPAPQYPLKEISDRTGIPTRTLSGWRDRVNKQSDWRPSPCDSQRTPACSMMQPSQRLQRISEIISYPKVGTFPSLSSNSKFECEFKVLLRQGNYQNRR